MGRREQSSKRRNLLREINNWITDRNSSLSGWASLVTIVSLPLAMLGLVFGYFQIKDILIEPTVELEFVHPTAVAYNVRNASAKTIENVLVSFGIFDLDYLAENPDKILSTNPLQIQSRTYDYINKESKVGPISLFSEYGIKGRRYFGIVYVSCKGCKSVETYWLYVKHGDLTASYYA